MYGEDSSKVSKKDGSEEFYWTDFTDNQYKEVKRALGVKSNKFWIIITVVSVLVLVVLSFFSWRYYRKRKKKFSET